MKNLVVMTLLLFTLQKASATANAVETQTASLKGVVSHSEQITNTEDLPGCADLLSVRAVVKFTVQSEDDEAATDIAESVRAAYRALCSFTTPQKGATIYYPNGSRATDYARTEGATWWYPNGTRITDYAGKKGATWWYSNGSRVTDYMQSEGATWWYPNGNRVTDYYGKKGATWWYPNGSRITDYAGTQGATWWYANGQRLSDYMGKAGATWWYANGSVWTNSGVELSEENLLYPHLLLSRLFRGNGDF